MPMQVASVSGTSTSYGGSALYVDAINPDGSFIEVEGRRSRHDSLLVPEKKEAEQVMDNEAVQQADKAQRAAEAARRAREEQLEEQLRRSIKVKKVTPWICCGRTQQISTETGRSDQSRVRNQKKALIEYTKKEIKATEDKIKAKEKKLREVSNTTEFTEIQKELREEQLEEQLEELREAVSNAKGRIKTLSM